MRPKGIIANPNCTTMAAMPVLRPLHDEAGLTAMVATTYQAVSGSGLSGVAELHGQARKVTEAADRLAFDGEAVDFPEPAVYARPIAFNVLPLAGKIVDDGSFETDEEQKLRNETRKILEHPGAQGLRHLRPRPGLHRALAADQRRVRAADQRGAGVRAAGRRAGRGAVRDPDPAAGRGPRPFLRGPDPQDETVEHGLALFLSDDNLRKGAALNAVQIAELVANA